MIRPANVLARLPPHRRRSALRRPARPSRRAHGGLLLAAHGRRAPAGSSSRSRGVSRDRRRARRWATVGLAAHPGGLRAHRGRRTHARRRPAAPRRSAPATPLRADEDGLDVDLGPGRAAARCGSPSASAGRGARSAASGSGTSSPASGSTGTRTCSTPRRGRGAAGRPAARPRGARAYAEKNWTPYAHGFPTRVVVGAGAGFARRGRLRRVRGRAAARRCARGRGRGARSATSSCTPSASRTAARCASATGRWRAAGADAA